MKLKDYCGTVNFMAPEIIAKKWLDGNSFSGYDKSCDIWSIGMILVDLLTGSNPLWKHIKQVLKQRAKKDDKFEAERIEFWSDLLERTVK